MILRIEDKVFTDIEFVSALKIEKQPSQFSYGCPIHQIKTENYCSECKSVVQTARIFNENPIEKVKITDLKGTLTETLPIWTMKENGYSYLMPNEELKNYLISKTEENGKPVFIQFKFIEKAGLNAKELDNYIVVNAGNLVRIRCDNETKSLIPYEIATTKKIKVTKAKSVIVKRKLEQPIKP